MWRNVQIMIPQHPCPSCLGIASASEMSQSRHSRVQLQQPLVISRHPPANLCTRCAAALSALEYSSCPACEQDLGVAHIDFALDFRATNHVLVIKMSGCSTDCEVSLPRLGQTSVVTLVQTCIYLPDLSI